MFCISAAFSILLKYSTTNCLLKLKQIKGNPFPTFFYWTNRKFNWIGTIKKRMTNILKCSFSTTIFFQQTKNLWVSFAIYIWRCVYCDSWYRDDEIKINIVQPYLPLIMDFKAAIVVYHCIHFVFFFYIVNHNTQLFV